jgi:DNA replication protein DnaC
MSNSLLTISLHEVPLNSAVLATISKHYPDIGYHSTQDSIVFDTSKLTEFEKECIRLDILFFKRNQNLPLENLCSHLENYTPQNESQKQLLEFAHKLINLKDDSRGAGLFMHGDAGIGKSHIAVGISKKFMAMGLESQFLVADRYSFGTQLSLAPSQVWIIDDMNSGFHVSSHLFRQVVLNAHERGGRVFVTSNKDYDELMHELFVGDSPANKIRYNDRTKGMFKILKVTGSSFRQANAWYQE